ncbi:hypothetical protein AvCA_38300 [Azotobacter vinelandii CA]|uniref:Uncharacterized protein n=2 Tax=Azotobacter vinelandii TaxID=354 RepID=C1DSM9_AZOVD|nr:hypothetical protein Avin_38300 [Azotobacter vinelandii DJ]AGK14516.1 hypothetical protein AvCA_38300 [Azotobacter vinelandii CA]AGK21630.1 hypothetical protein AvCA6_38300 [Azotobacter vinelandii CA6]
MRHGGHADESINRHDGGVASGTIPAKY